MIFGLLCLFVLGCNQEQTEPTQTNTTSIQTIAKRSLYLPTVTANQLMSDYINDAYNADKTYTENRFVVTGRIASIIGTETKEYINQFEYRIFMDTGEHDGKESFVLCEFHRSEGGALRKYKDGDTVKISGVVKNTRHQDGAGNWRSGGLRETVKYIYEGKAVSDYMAKIVYSWKKDPFEAPLEHQKAGNNAIDYDQVGRILEAGEEIITYFVVMDRCTLIE